MSRSNTKKRVGMHAFHKRRYAWLLEVVLLYDLPLPSDLARIILRYTGHLRLGRKSAIWLLYP